MRPRSIPLNSWGDVGYKDIGALEEMRASGNEFVRLSPEFIAAAKEEAEKWADEQAKDNAWFKKALDHRRAFQNKIKDGWGFFRFPMGTGSSDDEVGLRLILRGALRGAPPFPGLDRS